MIEPQKKIKILLQTAIITSFAMFASVVIASLATYGTSGSFQISEYGQLLAIVIPVLTAPVPTYFLLNLLAEREEYNEQLTKLSQKDALTDTYNRREFLNLVQSHLGLTRRHKIATALLMIDFDHFKQINDQHGHVMGDNVLVECTRVVKNLLREGDIFGRFGGEEFILLLTYTDNPFEAGERIRKEIEQVEFRSESGIFRTSVSIGGVSWTSGEFNLTGLTEIADKALYQVKSSGRNAVKIVDMDALAKGPHALQIGNGNKNRHRA